MKQLEAKKFHSILQELQKKHRNVVGVSWGYKEKNGVITNEPALIVRVENESSQGITTETQSVNEIHVEGYDIDVQYGAINPRRYVNTDKRGVVVKNIIRNWYGSAGPVIHSSLGGLSLLVNYHVAPELHGEITYDNRKIGEVSWHGAQLNLDISAVTLTPYGESIFKSHSSQGYGYEDAELDQTVWFDGGYGKPNLGRVVEIGLIAVKDPILGRFYSHSFTTVPLKGHVAAQPGDSGTPAWAMNNSGDIVCVGVVNGSMFNRSSIVPMKTTMNIMDAYWHKWGQVMSNASSVQDISKQNSDLEKQIDSLKRQVKSRDDAFSEISTRLSNLDPNTRQYFKIKQKDSE